MQQVPQHQTCGARPDDSHLGSHCFHVRESSENADDDGSAIGAGEILPTNAALFSQEWRAIIERPYRLGLATAGRSHEIGEEALLLINC
jgi:hypothetical protein